MNLDLRKTALTFLIPALVVLGSWILWINVDALPMKSMGGLEWVPDAVALVGALLAWRFSRTRITFGLIVLIVVSRVLSGFDPGLRVGPDAYGQVVYAALCILVPLNLIGISGLDERGVLTRRGATRLGVMAAQIVFVAFLGAPAVAQGSKALQAMVADFLHFRVFDKDFDLWTFLPQPALFAFAVALIVLLVRAVRTNHVIDNALLGLLVTSGAALHFVGKGPAPVLFLGLGAAIAITAMFLESYNMAFTDELTGLPGRRALMADAKKMPEIYTVAMGDVDHFKSFNDTYGHDVGDQVLRMVAQNLRKVGGGGRAYRYGGEEFTLLFPGKTGEEALPFIETVRQHVEHASFVLRDKEHRPEEKPPEPRVNEKTGQLISVTISLGAATKTDAHPDVDAVIKAADKALYASKDGGRNRTTVGQ